MSRTTIKDVALAAGVSPMTVSRVLNERHDVSWETRLRVQNVIRSLDYAPNSAARNLSQGRSNTLGVVTSHIEFYGPSRTLVGIEQKSSELGFSMLLELICDIEHDDGTEALRSLLAQQVGGIVWAEAETGDHRTALYEAVRGTSTPIIFINAEPRPGLSTLSVDNVAGARAVTNHLIEQGYRKIGIIAGPLSWTGARQREQGWHETLRAFGMDPVDRLRVEGDWTPASGEAALMSLLEQSPDMDAVFACNDQMALGALKAARCLGRRVPDDLGVVGFDDIPGAAYFSPPLTSVKQGLAAMGGRAVDVLNQMRMAQMSHIAFEPVVEWVQPKLVIRRSSLRNGGDGHPTAIA